MKNRRSPIDSIKLFFELHWAKILIGAFLLASIVWPIYALMKIDSYQRTYLMALFAMTPIQSILYAGIFMYFMYWLHYGGGSFSKISKKGVKGSDINVK